MQELSLKATNKYFEDWMKQSGKVKQLQMMLIIAAFLIVFLFGQLINNAARGGETKSTPMKSSSQRQKGKEQAQAPSPPKVTEAEAKGFIDQYLKEFFKTDEKSYVFIKQNTTEKLFISSIESEINARREQKINSEFRLGNYYVEPFSQTQIKAYVFGNEVFPNGDYENRRFTIEMILDLFEKDPKIKVSAIPVFKVD